MSLPEEFIRLRYSLARALLGVVAATACGDSAPRSAFGAPAGHSASQPSTVARDLRAVGASTWTRGGAETDTVLDTPAALAASAITVAVVDAGTSRVIAFDVRTGAVRWSLDTASRPLALRVRAPATLSPAGNDFLLTTRDLAIFSLNQRDGRAALIGADSGAGALQGMCDDDGALIAATARVRAPLHVVRSPSTAIAPSIAYPWTDLESAEPLVRQSRFTSWPGHGCVAGLVLGRGFATLDHGRWTIHPYVEAVALPGTTVTRRAGRQARRETVALESHTVASASISVDRDSLYVLFGGTTRYAWRVIDVYDLASGAYAHSILLPRPADLAVVSHQALFVIDSPHGLPRLSRYELRAVRRVRDESPR